MLHLHLDNISKQLEHGQLLTGQLHLSAEILHKHFWIVHMQSIFLHKTQTVGSFQSTISGINSISLSFSKKSFGILFFIASH